MHRGVVTCRPETPLTVVARMMAGHNIHCVVVWSDAASEDEEGTLCGVVSDLDLARAIAGADIAVPAQAVAATPAVTVGREATLRCGAELMATHGVAHLVVVKRNRPVGVISTLDLARAIAD